MRNSRLVSYAGIHQAGSQSEYPVSAKRVESRLGAGALPLDGREGVEVPLAGPHRVRVADRVFEDLLGAILRGELAPGEPVPTQRALSREFGVSPLVVRQAIHRLEELELVRVRQGSPTIVLDPNQAADVRLIQLQLEAATPGDALALAGIENRAVSTLPLLALATRRITEAELQALDELVAGLGDNPSAQALDDFQAVYWSAVAAATRNPLLQHQVRWWFHTVPRLRAATTVRVGSVSAALYRELNESMRARTSIVDSWLGLLTQLLDWTEAQPGHVLNQRADVDRAGVGFPRARARFARARSARATRAT
jgi:GntR family transcriptional regulator, transcriptional repressor for pyruvate dehydrogenase complex